MSNKDNEKESDKTDLSWKPEEYEFDNDNIKISDSQYDGAVVLTEEQKRILLREEIKKANRDASEYDSNLNNKKSKFKKDNGLVDIKARRVGSLATTITSLILTIISFLLVFFVLGSGDPGKIIILGLFVVFPMEIIASIMAVFVFITNIIFMSTGRFSFLVFFNFLLSIGLIAANAFIFYLGTNIVFH